MFENLTGKLQQVFKRLRGEGRLTEENITEALKEIRLALLEADVNFKVVKEVVDSIRAKALGQDVLSSFSPTQQVVRIVRDELVQLLGGSAAKLRFASQSPSVFFLVGLQGSGKTTSAGKLARWLHKGGRHPLLVSVDVYRPAAREQLAVVGKNIGVPVFAGSPTSTPVEIALAAQQEARQKGYDVLIVDTAGRLHVDHELMSELEQLKQLLQPAEVLFIADAMTGQDAVRSAEEFHRRVALTGVILTKIDGDARGGAALSIRFATGQSIKFIGSGEKYENLEPFHPDRMASRILGMGDLLSLVEKAEETVDREKAADLERKLQTNRFTLEDFREQILQARRMGPLDQVLSMLPSIGPFKGLKPESVDEKELVRTEAIINSMTAKERNHPQVINGSRRKRIAKGSGTSVQQVNQLLRQYDQVCKMMRGFAGRAWKKQAGKSKLPVPMP
ncbi:MAG: signal recognition particle protein [Acidobacteria bacterium]|nr:signal recognition particle protein [Acidobacteriota bacterium]